MLLFGLHEGLGTKDLHLEDSDPGQGPLVSSMAGGRTAPGRVNQRMQGQVEG